MVDSTDLALKAVHDIALSLIALDPKLQPQEFDDGMRLIESICRHRMDVRSELDHQRWSRV